MWITNQDRIWLDSAHNAEETDTPTYTAELKPTMMRLKDNRHGATKSAAQSSLMTTINEEDLTLVHRTLKNSISNSDTEIRTIRHPIDKQASTQIGTKIQTQIDHTTKTDQATPGATGKITVSGLSITSVLDQRIQIPNTIKTFHKETIQLHPTQFSLLTIRDKV